MDNKQKRLVIRVSRSSLSFSMTTDSDITYEPYALNSSISMAANLREALRTVPMLSEHFERVLVMVDSLTLMVPADLFVESERDQMYHHAFTGQEQQIVMHTVLPDLNAVALFSVQKDLRTVLNDRFDGVRYTAAMAPVWRHLHQRSFTGHRNKLYGYFHSKRLDLFSFQQNRFKFCNSFEASHAYDALYFLLYTWKLLRLEAEHDELHVMGDIPEQEWLLKELKRYLQKAYVINPTADFQQAAVTKIPGMPYDLMTLLVKGR